MSHGQDAWQCCLAAVATLQTILTNIQNPESKIQDPKVVPIGKQNTQPGNEVFKGIGKCRGNADAPSSVNDHRSRLAMR